MDLPQELIDSIVDAIVEGLDLVQDPWIVDNTVDVLESLRSCALVAHAFVRPCQIYIFHGLTLSDDERLPPELFSGLFAKSPHLASYVRALYFEYKAVEEDLEPIMHILGSITNLTRLDIYPHPESMWQSYPAPLRAAFLAAFALPSMHHITLWYFCFEDASELQTLLNGSASLKTLVLRSVTFGTTEPVESLEMSAEASPRVVLDSLQMYFLDAAHVRAMLDSFTVVDITRLRTLYLHNTPMQSLLTVNAPTIQHLKVRAYYSGTQSVPHATHAHHPADMFLDETVEADALAGAHCLQSLDLKVPFLPSLSKMVRIFGSLDHLTSLRTVSVSVSQKTHQAEWRELDGLLSELPALTDVHVYSASHWTPMEWHPEPPARTWMPVLARRDVLRIHGVAPEP
ncbi:hypothetical protein DFH09DRAFT_1360328 [Mycena vulgaris]|nr:hypothetical protein DFH09DRAFT_1360328 [Mycena vulgaris]